MIRISTNLIRIVLAAVIVVVATTTHASADVVRDWNIQLLRVPSPVGPPQARLLAIMHVAMHDAINSITGEYQTCGPAVNAPFGASPVAAGAAAAHFVLMTLVPASMIPTPNFDAALDASLADIPEPERTLGVNVGVEAAKNILALRKDDGFTTVVPYTPGSGAGAWVPTPPAFAPALLPGFGHVIPFALHSGDQFRPDGPPSLTSEQYAEDVNEGQMIGDVNAETLGYRTHAQSATARFWLGNSIPIFQQIARKISLDRELDLSENARFFALVSIAGVDAYIAASMKFVRQGTYRDPSDFDPATDALPVAGLQPVDRFMVARFSRLNEEVLRHYAAYDFQAIFTAINEFVTVDLSSFYLDVSKDRLYTFRADSTDRRSAQTAQYLIADGLTRLIAPIICLTADEIWRQLPGTREPSVHLADFPAGR